jgi:hypothetical protein
MNLARPPLAAVSKAFRFWLALRRLLPKRKCRAFGVHGAEKGPGVEKIYVINLDRVTGPTFCTSASERVYIRKPSVQFAARREP